MICWRSEFSRSSCNNELKQVYFVLKKCKMEKDYTIYWKDNTKHGFFFNRALT